MADRFLSAFAGTALQGGGTALLADVDVAGFAGQDFTNWVMSFTETSGPSADRLSISAGNGITLKQAGSHSVMYYDGTRIGFTSAPDTGTLRFVLEGGATPQAIAAAAGQVTLVADPAHIDTQRGFSVTLNPQGASDAGTGFFVSRDDGAANQDLVAEPANGLIVGNAGDDRLDILNPDGKQPGGHTTFDGGAGNDSLTIQSVEVPPAAAYSLDLGAPGFQFIDRNIGYVRLVSIENFTADHAYSDTVVTGTAGTNRITLGAGTIHGAGGDDILQVTNGTLDGGDGDDTAVMPVYYQTRGMTVDLRSTAVQDNGASRISFVSIENIVGSVLGDTFNGTDGANRIEGRSGNDYLYGNGGNDVLVGGIAGDKDSDYLTGGAGHDVFRWLAADDSPAGSGRDKIGDFTQGQDVLDLAALGGGTALSFVGTARFDGHAGEVRYVNTTYATIVEVDLNGDRTADAQVQLVGVVHLTASDFLLG